MKARIVATGSYYPTNIIDNQQLTKIVDSNDEWIQQRTGIKQRRFSELNTSLLAYYSALDTLKSSSITKDELDLIIVCTFTPDHFTPSVANQVKKYLEIENDIPSFDLNAACTGFIYGLKVAQAFIETNMYRHILLIGAENISKHLDFSDRTSSILFGDGAAAVLLQADTVGIIDTVIHSRNDTNESILVSSGVSLNKQFTHNDHSSDSRLKMKGQDVFRFATKVLVKSIKDMLLKHELNDQDIKYYIVHQANLRIIEFAIKSLGFDETKFIINLDQVGNTSAASIGLVLDELNKENKIEKNDLILLVAFGSGLTYGTSLIEY